MRTPLTRYLQSYPQNAPLAHRRMARLPISDERLKAIQEGDKPTAQEMAAFTRNGIDHTR